MNRLRPTLKAALKRLGLLPAARWLRHLVWLATNPEFRSCELERRHAERLYRLHHRRFLRFKRQYRDVLRHCLISVDDQNKRALVVSSLVPQVEVQLALIKALELAGFVPVVLASKYHDPALREYYTLASVKEIRLWSEFADPPDLAIAEAVIEGHQSVQELLTFEYAGSRVGRYALSSALRGLRLGSLDLRSPSDRQVLVGYLASSMAFASAAQRILRTVRPQLALVIDAPYTPEAELVDHCLANGCDAIRWGAAHSSNSLMLKRFTGQNRYQQLASLSAESWRLVRGMEWTCAQREQLERELYGAYASGDWYSAEDTQFNKRLIDADAVRKRLGLDPGKKTAVVFPHIMWDASLSWGQDLFLDYEEWLIETVRTACANDEVNWVIRIHPAHVGKGVREGYAGEPAEVIALRQQIGKLPPHVFMLPADSDINTFSLFGLMDYCLTVRGTVGIEAARLGIPVLTAGTGRYSHKGFTIDSESRQQYLERVRHIQGISPLLPEQRELAERYAYGLFVLRPLRLSSVTVQSRDHKNQLNNYQINLGAREEWCEASDLRAFAQWVADSSQPDFLMPLQQQG